MSSRPLLFTSYRSDQAIFRTRAQLVWLLVGLLFLVWLPFQLDRSWLISVGTAFIAAIGAIGLNLVTGYAGQVSLGHAFFLGVGAYAGAALSAERGGELIGFGLDMILWLPLAGLIAAAVGVLVAPIALRLKGLYLALVTLGLVFLGEHIFRNWETLTGGPAVGREPARLRLLGLDFDQDGEVLGVFMNRELRIYFLGLVLLVVMGILAKNLVRSRIGRAFSAIRDRDIAAEIMGVNLTRYKVIAFAVSSFYAGVAGSLLFTVTGFVDPISFSLVLSILYIAMVVIGGASTIAGSIMGAAFVTLLPRFIELVPFVGQGGGVTAARGVWVGLVALGVLAAVLALRPGSLRDLAAVGRGAAIATVVFVLGLLSFALSAGQVERVIFGLLIVVFLIVEPLGLYGIWFRIRNYWKAWPFSY